jgi:hypothetical protein
MKSLIALLGLMIASPAVAGECLGKFEGNWVNPQVIQFKAKYVDCDHVDLLDVTSGRHYEIDLTGTKPLEISIFNMNFQLKFRGSQGIPVDAIVTWKFANHPGDESGPALQMHLTFEEDFEFGGEGAPIRLRTWITSFAYRPGSLGNLFDEGLNLAVAAMNRLDLPELLSNEFQTKNDLFRKEALEGRARN